MFGYLIVGRMLPKLSLQTKFSQIGGLVLYVKYDDIVASCVQNCSVVITDLKHSISF